jgi:hypothetical protein
LSSKFSWISEGLAKGTPKLESAHENNPIHRKPDRRRLREYEEGKKAEAICRDFGSTKAT